MLGIVMAGSVLTKNSKKWTPALLLLAAVAGSLCAGMGLRFREIVEGPFGFLDGAMSICCASLFVYLLCKNGVFESLLIKLSHIKNSFIRSMALLGLVALPAALTGLASASVLCCAKPVSNQLKKSGVGNANIVAIIAAGSFLGMILPPNCLPAMIAANGAGSVLPTPYNGYFLPLLVLGLPAFLLYALLERKSLSIAPMDMEKPRCTASLWVLAVVSLLVILEELLDAYVFFGGQTLLFAFGSIAMIVIQKGFGSFKDCSNVLCDGLMLSVVPLAGVFALGSFIEVTSMSGVRGYYSLLILGIDVPVLMIVIMGISLLIGLFFAEPIPAFLATYAMFPVAWLANNVVVTGVSSALAVVSLLAIKGGLVDKVRESADLQDVSYKQVLPHLLVPAATVLLIGAIMVLLDKSLSFLVF